MDDPSSNPESRRWRPWLYGFTLLTLVSVFGVTWGLESLDLSRGTRLALALTPVALWSGAMLFLVLSLRALDELQVRIQLEALAIAFPGAIMIGLSVEYLQKAGFLVGVAFGQVWPFMLLLYLPALAIAHWRYR